MLYAGATQTCTMLPDHFSVIFQIRSGHLTCILLITVFWNSHAVMSIRRIPVKVIAQPCGVNAVKHSER